MRRYLRVVWEMNAKRKWNRKKVIKIPRIFFGKIFSCRERDFHKRFIRKKLIYGKVLNWKWNLEERTHFAICDDFNKHRTRLVVIQSILWIIDISQANLICAKNLNKGRTTLTKKSLRWCNLSHICLHLNFSSCSLKVSKMRLC